MELWITLARSSSAFKLRASSRHEPFHRICRVIVLRTGAERAAGFHANVLTSVSARALLGQITGNDVEVRTPDGQRQYSVVTVA